MADKLRQIERFTEILGHLVEGSPFRDGVSCAWSIWAREKVT